VSRAEDVLGRLGTLGVLGIGVLLFCLPFYFSALRPAEQELAAQRDAAERLRSRGPFRAVTADARADDLLRFYALLAQAARLELRQGEYRLDKRAAGPVAYRITLPMHGSYAQMRAFVDAVLREMPLASVDALRFERERAADARLNAQVHLTLHFRPGDDAVRR
jgi:hypothetical protein